jgi:hypothetical protein
MMDLFSRRQWKKWAYNRLHDSKPGPKARALDEDPPESEYSPWLLPGLIAGSVILILIYTFVLR